MAIAVGLDICFVGIGIELLHVGDDSADSLGRSCSGVPRMSLQVWEDSTEEIEELVRMLFLDICKLLGGCVANERSAPLFQKPE